jgi:hypothetical protein
LRRCARSATALNRLRDSQRLRAPPQHYPQGKDRR